MLIERERRQHKAGRLDLLLSNPDEDRRYEVELMLGQTDEAHIIRCIENAEAISASAVVALRLPRRTRHYNYIATGNPMRN